jgi:hypothetical protein
MAVNHPASNAWQAFGPPAAVPSNDSPGITGMSTRPAFLLASSAIAVLLHPPLLAAQAVPTRDSTMATMVGATRTAEVRLVFQRSADDLFPDSARRVWRSTLGDSAWIVTTAPIHIGTLAIGAGYHQLWLVTRGDTLELGLVPDSATDQASLSRSAVAVFAPVRMPPPATLFRMAFRAQQHGTDTTGIVFEAAKSRGPVEYDAVVERVGMQWSLRIDWGYWRWAAAVTVDARADAPVHPPH